VIDPYAHPEPTTTESSVLRLVVGVMTTVVLIVGVIAAIGHDDKKVDPVALLGAAPDAVRDAGSARMVISATLNGTPSPVDATGLVDFRTDASEMTMSIAGSKITMRFVDHAIFLSLPAMTGLPKPWIEVPVTSAGASPIGNAGSAAGYVDALRGAGDVTVIGRERVNGFDTTHLRASIDIGKAADQLRDDQ
jgi:hypothetical protein